MEEKLFNKNFINITLINFVVYMVYYLFTVIIALIATNELGASLSQAGLATGIYILGTLLARLFFGKQLEIIGRKMVLRGGAIFYLITTIAYLFMPNLGILYLVRFLNGFGYGVVSTATNTIVTAYIPASKRGEGINYYGLSTSLAAAIGPFIGAYMLSLGISFQTIIYVCIALVAVVTVASIFFPVQNIELSDEQLAAGKAWTFDSFIEKKAVFISVIAFLMGVAYASVLAYLTIYTKELNLATVGSFFFVVYALVITATRPSAGRLMDVKGDGWVLYPSFVFLTAGLWLLGLVSTGWALLIAGALVGLGYGTFMSCGQAVSLHGLKEHRFVTAMSTYMVGLDLGLGAGPYMLGILKNFLPGTGAAAFSEIYLIAGIIPVICLILYFVRTRKVKPQDELTIELDAVIN